MSALENRQLGTLSLAALLVSAHYGLGFILGTAEQALTVGIAGSLYPVSISLGAIALVGLARFYWTEVEQIWTLLGNRYGKAVKALIGLMSWSSLIGIHAVQIISGAFILRVLEVPTTPSMAMLVLLAMVVSLLPAEKAGRIIQGLLMFNILALLYALGILHRLPDYLRSPLELLPALEQISPGKVLGISLSTMLVVLIDMKCQQFVVQAKSLRSLYQGCLLAAVLLFLLAFLPSSAVIAARNANIFPAGLDGKEAIPYLLSWIGGGVDRPLGIALILTLLVPALGIGSSVLRIQTKTVLDLEILPEPYRNRYLVAAVNALLGLIVALKGGSIINLIVQFYAAYISAVWIPFAAYLLERAGWYRFTTSSVRLSLAMGSLSALSVLVVTLVLPEVSLFGSAELSIMAIGLGVGSLSLIISQLTEKYFPTLKPQEEEN